MTDKGYKFLEHWIENSEDPDILDFLETQAIKNGSLKLAFIARERKMKFKKGTKE